MSKTVERFGITILGGYGFELQSGAPLDLQYLEEYCG
jgi:hypothetical protein